MTRLDKLAQTTGRIDPRTIYSEGVPGFCKVTKQNQIMFLASVCAPWLAGTGQCVHTSSGVKIATSANGDRHVLGDRIPGLTIFYPTILVPEFIVGPTPLSTLHRIASGFVIWPKVGLPDFIQEVFLYAEQDDTNEFMFRPLGWVNDSGLSGKVDDGHDPHND